MILDIFFVVVVRPVFISPHNFGWLFYFSTGSCPQNRQNFSNIDRLSSLIKSSIDSCF